MNKKPEIIRNKVWSDGHSIPKQQSRDRTFRQQRMPRIAPRAKAVDSFRDFFNSINQTLSEESSHSPAAQKEIQKKRNTQRPKTQSMFTNEHCSQTSDLMYMRFGKWYEDNETTIELNKAEPAKTTCVMRKYFVPYRYAYAKRDIPRNKPGKQLFGSEENELN